LEANYLLSGLLAVRSESGSEGAHIKSKSENVRSNNSKRAGLQEERARYVLLLRRWREQLLIQDSRLPSWRRFFLRQDKRVNCSRDTDSSKLGHQ